MIEDEHFISYCSGYLDGDGCFYLGKSIQKPKNIVVYEYSIQVVSVKKEVLDLFSNKIGGFVRKKPDKKGCKSAFAWTTKGQEAADFAKKCLPHLVDKKKCCSFFIEFSSLIHRNSWKQVCQNTIKSREIIITNIRGHREMEDLITKEAIERLNDVKNTINPIPRDYAYLAGLIDSEGCFRIKKWKPKNKPNHVYAICLEIGNTKLPLMPWLIERFGGNVTFIPQKPRKRASAIWSLAADSLFSILPKIHPHLTSKKSACQKLMEFQDTILPNGGDRHSELFQALFREKLKVRERIVSEIHGLNAKGS